MSIHRMLAVVAGILAVIAAFLGSSRPGAASLDAAALAADIEGEKDHVTALELAAWIRARKEGLRVFDVRPDSEFQAYHIPSAERAGLRELAKRSPMAGETLVLYSGGGAHAAQAWVLLRASGHRDVYFLSGGLVEWMDDVMSPTLPPRSGEAQRDSIIARAGELSRYFGGVPRTGAVPLPDVGGIESSVVSAVARARRRGC